MTPHGLMRKAIPGLIIPVLLGVPLWINASAGVGACSGVAGFCLVLGVIRSSLATTTAGGALALSALTLAIWQSASSLSVFGAFGFGLALLLLVDGVHFVDRFGNARVDWSVWRQQVPWWIGRAAIALAAAIMLVLVSSALAIALPALGRPILAGIGALMAFGAAIGLRWTGDAE
jgi:hypothetical protein